MDGEVWCLNYPVDSFKGCNGENGMVGNRLKLIPQARGARGQGAVLSTRSSGAAVSFRREGRWARASGRAGARLAG